MNQKKVNIRLHITLIFTLLAGVLFCNCGGGGGGGGNNNSQTIDKMSAVIDSAANNYNNLIENGTNKDEATTKTIDWLKKQDGITDAYLDIDQKYILVEDITGILTLIITDNVAASYVSLEQFKLSVKKLLGSYPDTASPIRSIILDPYRLDLPNATTVNEGLNIYSYPNVNYLSKRDVWAEVFRNLSDYDIIYYVGHGAINPKTGTISIGTGELFSESRLKYYNDELKKLGLNNDGDLYMWRFKPLTEPATFGITSYFIEVLSKNLKATFVYIDACHTIETDKMAMAFLRNGAKAYFGWDALVFALNTDQYPKSLIDSLFAGEDIQTAYNKMSFNFINHATLRYIGDNTAKLPLNGSNVTLPGSISITPVSGTWTSTPQDLSVNSNGATAIYYTMVNTTDGSTPADPREPTSTDNDGSVLLSGGAGTFQLYATAGQNKHTKLRFKGYNSAGAGPASVVYSYNINLSSTSPLTTWSNTLAIGGNPVAILQTSDGGYIIADDKGGYCYLIKTDSNGNEVWEKNSCGYRPGWDHVTAAQKVADGGIIVAGNTSTGTDADFYLIKTDSSGNVLWTKTYGGDIGWLDEATAVQQTTDGGYIMSGYMEVYQNSENALFLLKTDSNGNMVWLTPFINLGAFRYEPTSVQQTSDGGYIFVGSIQGKGEYDYYIVKTDSKGNITWSNRYSGNGLGYAFSVQQISGGGYIIAGTKTTTGGNFINLVKIDSSGNLLWSKTYDRYDSNYAYAMEASDGGYIILGSYYNNPTTGVDVLLIKTDSSGNVLWKKSYGGTGTEHAKAIQKTSDGGYIIVADAGVGILLIKTDANGDVGSVPSTVTISVSPTSTTMAPAAIQQFAATVTGTTATSVIWSIQEGSAGGTITSGGLFTAPSTPGTYHVVVTSQAENTKSATAVVTVTTPTTVSAPTFTPAPGTYASAQSVTLSTTTSGATIRYTMDGSTPSSTVGTVYAGPIPVSSSSTIQAVAYLSGWTPSSVSSGVYTITIVQESVSGIWTGTYSWQCTPVNFGQSPITFSLVQATDFSGARNHNITGTISYLGATADIYIGNRWIVDSYNQGGGIWTGTISEFGEIIEIQHLGTLQLVINQFTGTINGNTIKGTTLGGGLVPIGCSAASGATGAFEVFRQ